MWGDVSDDVIENNKDNNKSKDDILNGEKLSDRIKELINNKTFPFEDIEEVFQIAKNIPDNPLKEYAEMIIVKMLDEFEPHFTILNKYDLDIHLKQVLITIKTHTATKEGGRCFTNRSDLERGSQNKGDLK